MPLMPVILPVLCPVPAELQGKKQRSLSPCLLNKAEYLAGFAIESLLRGSFVVLYPRWQRLRCLMHNCTFPRDSNLQECSFLLHTPYHFAWQDKRRKFHNDKASLSFFLW